MNEPMKTPVKPAKSVMDFRPSQGLASGIKRIGGRNGTTRLGKSNPRERRGKSFITHKF